jgi:hypothetical protein
MQTIYCVHAQLLAQKYLDSDHVYVFVPHLPDTHQGVYHTPFSSLTPCEVSRDKTIGRPPMQTIQRDHAQLLAQNNEVLLMLKWFAPHLPDTHHVTHPYSYCPLKSTMWQLSSPTTSIEQTDQVTSCQYMDDGVCQLRWTW